MPISKRDRSSLHLVVAAQPGSSLTVAPELGLVKAALLYGEKVTLLSPITTMLLGVEALEHFSPLQQIDLVRRVAPYLSNGAELAESESGLNQLEDLLRSTTHSASLSERLLRAGVVQQLQPVRQILSEAVRGLERETGIDQLSRARAKGYVQIESANPDDAVDLLASCIISASQTDSGARRDDSQTSRIVETFIEKLSRHLSSGVDYLIFDEQVASLTEAAIREGLFKPARGPAGRCAQAMTATAFMGRLPTFPDATVDEVLDIRAELAKPLTQFRSAMVSVSKEFTSEAWETDFDDEIQNAWVESVAPAIDEIEASVHDNRSLLTKAAGVAGVAHTSFPGLVVAAAGIGGHDDPVVLTGAALSAGVPLLQALRDQRREDRDIRMQPFYFLYAVQQSLS
jgi:hypothetical protein